MVLLTYLLPQYPPLKFSANHPYFWFTHIHTSSLTYIVFVINFDHLQWQWGTSSCIFRLNKNVRFNSFHIFDALTFILYHKYQLVLSSKWSQYTTFFHFEVTLLIIQTIVVVINANQVFLIQPILSFHIIRVNTTMHNYTNHNCCYHRYYFTVC